MSRIIGIDYGRKKIGLAHADGNLAAPLSVIKVRNLEDALYQIPKIIDMEEAQEVVIGVSEGEMKKESEEFGRALAERTGLTINYQNETLSTIDVQELAIEAGINRKKRKNLEDAFSATLILQNFLEERL